MPHRLVCLAIASAAALTACNIPFIDSPPEYGFISVSSGGELLTPGNTQVPPTLDLRLHAEKPFRLQDVTGRVDSQPLAFTSEGSDVVAKTAALPLDSSHHLDVSIAGRAQGISLPFSVIPPTSAMFAAHVDPAARTVVDGVFDDAPMQSVVASELPGARLAWRDPTHVRLTWPGPPPASVDLPEGIPTARGSHLGAAVHLGLTGLTAGELARVRSPGAPPVAGTNLVAFVTDTSAANSSLVHHQSVLDWVSATGWQAQSDGTIQGSPDPVAVSRAKSVRLPLWPDLENDFTDPTGTDSLLKSQQAVGTLVAATVQAVVKGGYPGVNLDFEAMNPDDKDAYTAFVKSLAGALHQHGAQLTVDVVPHGSSGVNHFSAAYDVPALGSAADYIDIMAYDQHAEGSSPGPVAGLDWVKAELAGTLPGLAASHTLLGIPLYGRTWSSGSGSSDSYASVLASLGDPGVRVDYDFSAQTPFIESADGTDVTYFDDAASLALKIGLAHQYGLAGVAAWRLGFEDPAFWNLFG
jgi:spore germination protein YaaH